MMRAVYFLAFLVISLWSLAGQAQDKIIRKDGTVVKAKILGTDNTYIRYKRFDNLTGPDYFMYRTEVQTFEYEKKVEPVTKTVVPATTQQTTQPQDLTIKSAAKSTTAANAALMAMEQKAARYKTKSTIGTAVGAGAIVGGIVTFVILNSSYSTYKSQLTTTNTTYTDWYSQNYGKAPDATDLAQPKGFIQFGSPGIYAAAAGIVGGAVLTIMGRKNAGLARQMNREIALKRRKVSMLPLINGPTQFAGLQLKLTF